MKLKTKNIFDYLIKKFNDRGFSVKTYKTDLFIEEGNENGNRYFIAENENAKILVYEKDGWYKRGEESVFIENKEIFNKWSQAPVKLSLPRTQEQLAYMFEMIAFISTEEGKEGSNKFTFSQFGYPDRLS